MINFRTPDYSKVPTDLQQYLSQDSLLGDVAGGIAGENAGIMLHTPKLKAIVGDFTKGQYILVGADSGVGKTTFTDEFFTFAAYKAKLQGFNVGMTYFSWEISKRAKRAKLASYITNVMDDNVRINANNIRGTNGAELTDAEIAMLQRASPSVNAFFDEHCNFQEQPMTPSEFNEYLNAYALANGTFTFVDGEAVSYTPQDPSKMNVFIIDHIALCDTDSGQTLKQAIDEISKFIVQFRNMCNFTFVVVQQFNGDMQNVFRSGNTTENSIIPQRSDFGDSKYTFRDADIVIGLVKPFAFGLGSYQGYDLTIWRNNLIVAVVIKNRSGSNNRSAIMACDYCVGRFEELPPPEAFRGNRELYAKYNRADEAPNQISYVTNYSTNS